MKLNKPKFWQTNNSIYSIILLPITFVLLVLIFLKKKITRKNIFNIPILCVGNIYVGGTGKTPLSILIANELKIFGKKPVIIKKFYKKHEDEHLLIKEKSESIILRNRINAIKIAEKNYDLAIMDDGFQDYSIKKDFNILCFHSQQLIGNGFVFPSGPLRENLNAIKNVQVIIINGEKKLNFEKKILKINKNIKIFYSKYLLLDIENLQNEKILAFAGIGNPENFFNLLIACGLDVKKTLSFPDHYEFNENELLKIIQEAKKNNYKIVTTEKDFFRIKKYQLKEIYCCKTKLEIFEKNELISEIKRLYD
jgi:tetraacyldisaccharide 4'-kinase|tara:strand:- start:885 stop:1811 length:927 start_codon:yes stop_codon:yes gene_type:complete